MLLLDDYSCTMIDRSIGLDDEIAKYVVRHYLINKECGCKKSIGEYVFDKYHFDINNKFLSTNKAVNARLEKIYKWIGVKIHTQAIICEKHDQFNLLSGDQTMIEDIYGYRLDFLKNNYSIIFPHSLATDFMYNFFERFGENIAYYIITTDCVGNRIVEHRHVKYANKIVSAEREIITVVPAQLIDA